MLIIIHFFDYVYRNSHFFLHSLFNDSFVDSCSVFSFLFCFKDRAFKQAYSGRRQDWIPSPSPLVRGIKFSIIIIVIIRETSLITLKVPLQKVP